MRVGQPRGRREPQIPKSRTASSYALRIDILNLRTPFRTLPKALLKLQTARGRLRTPTCRFKLIVGRVPGAPCHVRHSKEGSANLLAHENTRAGGLGARSFSRPPLLESPARPPIGKNAFGALPDRSLRCKHTRRSDLNPMFPVRQHSEGSGTLSRYADTYQGGSQTLSFPTTPRVGASRTFSGLKTCVRGTSSSILALQANAKKSPEPVLSLQRLPLFAPLHALLAFLTCNARVRRLTPPRPKMFALHGGPARSWPWFRAGG